jgi:hypothetical protein
VWNTGGCASWYLDAHGRNTVLWPRTTFKFRELLRRFDVEQYVVEPIDGTGTQTGTDTDTEEGAA